MRMRPTDRLERRASVSVKEDGHEMIRYCIAYRHGQRLGEIEMERISEILQ